MKVLLRVIEWSGTAVVALAVLVAVFLLAGPRFGYETHPVLSGSMEPTLPVGGVIVTARTPVDRIETGDIVTLDAGSSLVTHRVVGLMRSSGEVAITTQGDANNEPDSAVVHLANGQLLPKTIFYVPYAGFGTSTIRASTGSLGLVLIPGLALIVLLIHDMVKSLRPRPSQ